VAAVGFGKQFGFRLCAVPNNELFAELTSANIAGQHAGRRPSHRTLRGIVPGVFSDATHVTTSPAHVRLSCRGIVLDPDDRVLLVAHAIDVGTVWVGPGGGVEPGESLREALARELHEETGLVLDSPEEPPLVWVRERSFPELTRAGIHRQREHYFLVRTGPFDPRPGVPTSSAGHPDVEGILATRWWSPAEIAAANTDVLFAPRGFARLLRELLDAESAGAIPAAPLAIGM
jgi:8-oxo-dGTP pyrophosphatase MutT (NUDIX family)